MVVVDDDDVGDAVVGGGAVGVVVCADAAGCSCWQFKFCCWCIVVNYW